MYIKQFREQQIRVQDPLRPGKRVFETRLNPTGCHSLTHEGETYDADEEGWIDVPNDIGEKLVKFRGPRGEQFFTPEIVGEEIVAGRIKPDEVDELPKETGPRLKGRAKASAA